MLSYFPISKPMVGSVIPGQLVRVQTKLANYPDFSLEKLITVRKTVDPVTEFPDMNNEHGEKHPMIHKLHKLLNPSYKPKQPIAQGYQPVRENLQWRQS